MTGNTDDEWENLGNVWRKAAGFGEAGFLVEGEFGYEISQQGEAFRSTVKFQPKESLFSKLLARFNVTLDPTKLLQ